MHSGPRHHPVLPIHNDALTAVQLARGVAHAGNSGDAVLPRDDSPVREHSSALQHHSASGDKERRPARVGFDACQDITSEVDGSPESQSPEGSVDTTTRNP